MAKDSLVKGTIILMAAAFVARFLGVIQRIPLKALLNDQGMATYSIAYNVYFALLIVATAGMPSAISKLIAEKTELGEHGEAAAIYRAAIVFAIFSGALSAVLIYVLAPWYADHLSQDPDSALSIQALAPALLLFPLIAVMRGYFQGRQRMMANGMSQIVEQILRVATAVLLAYLAVRTGIGLRWASAGASFGGVLGSVGAAAVMLWAAVRLRRSDRSEMAGAVDSIPAAAGLAEAGIVAASARARKERRHEETPAHSVRAIYGAIFRLAIPISLISLAVPLINFIDSSTVIALLRGHIGFEQAKIVLGILGGRAQSLAGIPTILAVALSQSGVPVISSAHARGDRQDLIDKSSLALRLGLLTGLPMVLGLVVAGAPVNGLLFGDTHGTWINSLLVIASLFQILMMTSAAVLMGLGRMRAPTLNVFIGLAVKLAASFLLSQLWGIYGIVSATMLCFIVTMGLNLIALTREVRFSIMGGASGWLKLVAVTALTILIGWGLAWSASQWVHLPSPRLAFLVQTILVGGISVALYGILALALGLLRESDLQGLPARVRRWLPKGRGQAVREHG